MNRGFPSYRAPHSPAGHESIQTPLYEPIPYYHGSTTCRQFTVWTHIPSFVWIFLTEFHSPQCRWEIGRPVGTGNYLESTSCRRFTVWTHILPLDFSYRVWFTSSLMNYTNQGYHASGHAIMNIFPQKRTLHSCLITRPSYLLFTGLPPTVFDLLHPDFVQDALYSSAKRQKEHAVTCQPETRTKILSDIRFWADSATTTPICWLTGPAGTGKTTVAHTIAEEYANRKQLAATFFFWRKTEDRDDINKLVATLAYQIAKKVPSAKEQMEENLKLQDAPWAPISKLSLEHQLLNLILNVNPSDPNLIVIDGLDECVSREGICQLIEWIRKNKSPFRFLLTSRPEPELKACFTPGLGACAEIFGLFLLQSRRTTFESTSSSNLRRFG